MQCGFRTTKSAVNAVKNDVSVVLDVFQDTLFDFSKDFETIGHEIMLAKLDFNGFQGTGVNFYDLI